MKGLLAKIQQAMKAYRTRTKDPLLDEESLRSFMDEMETTRKQKARSPKGGWGYLKRLAPH